MKIRSATAVTGKEAFPEAALRQNLTEWWNAETERLASDPFAPKEKGTLYDVLPDIDSLAVVESLVIAEKLLNCNIPARIIKSGGYDSSDEMIDHLMPQLRKIHELSLAS